MPQKSYGHRMVAIGSAARAGVGNRDVLHESIGKETPGCQRWREPERRQRRELPPEAGRRARDCRHKLAPLNARIDYSAQGGCLPARPSAWKRTYEASACLLSSDDSCAQTDGLHGIWTTPTGVDQAVGDSVRACVDNPPRTAYGRNGMTTSQNDEKRPEGVISVHRERAPTRYRKIRNQLPDQRQTLGGTPRTTSLNPE